MALTLSDLRTWLPDAILAPNAPDLAANIDTIINDAEYRLHDELDHDAFRDAFFGQTSNGAEIDVGALGSVLEVRWIAAHGAGADRIPLEPIDLAAAHALYADETATTPRFYAETGASFVYALFPPPPSGNVSLDIFVNVRPPLLADGAEENVLTQRYPRVLRRACELEAATFMRQWRQIEERHRPRYDEAVAAANADIARRRRDETGVRPRDTANVRGPGS